MPPALEEHYINETSDASTAWIEGWADFFPLAVQNDPDLRGWNLEVPTWCTPNWDDGNTVEGRVAGALWDIFDSTNDSSPHFYDSFSDGFTNIWDIISTQTDNTFREFWDAWNASGYPKQPALMAIFQNTIDYRGPGDVNADGWVDGLDLEIIGSAWQSQKGESNWDQRADLNPDGIIDGMDLTILGMYWGQYYDP